VILGSQAFVESYIQRLKQKLRFKRPRAAKPLTALGSKTLWVFRAPRVQPTG
jgi:hypothetical protein